MEENQSKFSRGGAIFSLITIIVPLLVMWMCISLMMNGYYADDRRTITNAFFIGNAMPILTSTGIVGFWAMMRESKKIITAQQNQIDELKRELEEMKQNR
jgi:type VI protein secretion system component VasK